MTKGSSKKPENIEIEAKFLDIDPKQIEAKLGAAGARLLGLNPADKKLFSTTQVYALNGIRDKDYVSMTFGEWVKRG